MQTMQNYIDNWIEGTVNPLIHDALMSDPVQACQYAECVEEYQWAIQHWYHADVCVIDEINTGPRNPYFNVVMEYWKKDADGEPTYKTVKMSLSSEELVGIYRYYKMRSSVSK